MVTNNEDITTSSVNVKLVASTNNIPKKLIVIRKDNLAEQKH